MRKLALVGISFLVSAASLAAEIDGSIWLVKTKTCGSQTQVLNGEEKFIFGNGMFAYIYRLSEDQSQICNQAQIFARVIQSSGIRRTVYEEKALLRPQNQRTLCKYKSSGTPISDRTTRFEAPAQEISLTVNEAEAAGSADWTGSPLCPNAGLHFGLKRK